MDKVKMIKDAIELAKAQGVQFGESTPSFRPEGLSPHRFHIKILTNTSYNTAGHASIDQHFNVLDCYDEKKLANYFIDVFNGLNIERKAKRII